MGSRILDFVKKISNKICDKIQYSPAAKRGFWVQPCTKSTHNGFLQIMHPRTFHIKNPSDAKLALLSVLSKWPVSMATIVEIEKYKK